MGYRIVVTFQISDKITACHQVTTCSSGDVHTLHRLEAQNHAKLEGKRECFFLSRLQILEANYRQLNLQQNYCSFTFILGIPSVLSVL